MGVLLAPRSQLPNPPCSHQVTAVEAVNIRVSAILMNVPKSAILWICLLLQLFSPIWASTLVF